MLTSSNHFLKYPLIILATAFMAGILGIHIVTVTTRVLICLASVGSLISLACLLRRRWFGSSVALCLTFTLGGAILAAIEKQKGSADSLSVLIDQGLISSGDRVELTGILEQQPEAAPASFYLTLGVEKLKLKGTERRAFGTVSLLLPISTDLAVAEYDKLDLRYGTRIRVISTLKRADTFRNPGGTSFREYLDRRGLAAGGLVKSPMLIERLSDEPVPLPLAVLYDWRQRLQREINLRFAPEAAGVLNASLLGNRYFLSRDASERFREGGTFHVLVISGLHITFIGGLVLLLARRLSSRKLTQFAMSVIVLWTYALAVGAEASVVRAALMFTFVALAPVVARRGASLNALGVAALTLLAARPRDLFDPSFQLTFLSVAAIVVFAWPLLQRMKEIGSWRPTRASPYPPSCSRWLRTTSEALFWREQPWRRELTQINYRYRLFKTPWARRFERLHLQGVLRYGFAAVLISVCVQITMLPLLIVYFHRLSISGLVLNIGVSLIMAILIFTALIALVLCQLSVTAVAPLVSLTNALEWLMTHGVDPFTRLGIAALRLPEYSGAASVLYAVFFAPLLIFALVLPHWNPLARPSCTKLNPSLKLLVCTAAVVQLLLVVVLVFHPFSAPVPGDKLRIDFLDVGQGDAALVTMPDGTTLLVDGGGRPRFLQKNAPEPVKTFQRDTRSIGEAVVSEYVWWRGMDRVDYVLATHADADHMEGLNDVARNFQIRAALVARNPAKDPEFLEFAGTMRQQRIPIEVVGAGDTLCFGGVRASVLWPPASDQAQAQSGNNDSLVLLLEYGARKILMLADIESKAEQALLSRLEANGLDADVVKVAHHGSRTSSTADFVNAVSPKLAVISVGRQSMFGHPHREVVERWGAVGAEVMTTGLKGTITISTDGSGLDVSTFVP
ncbi:MAG TPA: ComEC/Rec2 family competence protein [Pyrinomonadaceae bacterium]|nr:ComEC/Rec2 family competence protein [Pyrinomonadaceae bacterium]